MSYLDEFKKNINSNKKIILKFLSLEEQVQLNRIKDKILFPNNCERKRVIINDIDDINNEDYISIIKIRYDKRFKEINHRDVLGSLIGLGIKRECIGDIIVSNDIFVYITKEMENFIINNLIKIGNVSVTIEKSSFEELSSIQVDNYVEDTFIVSSYRLDTIIGERCCLSRDKAKQYITLKNVKINGIINCNPDYIVKIDDLISIHRFGRLIIKEEVKKTKKDNYVLRVLKTK